jgi:hypothetical protein
MLLLLFHVPDINSGLGSVNVSAISVLTRVVVTVKLNHGYG